MIETYFAAPHVLDRMRSGPMAPYLDALAAELQSQEYSRKSIRRQLRNADSFGSWVAEQKLTVAGIMQSAADRLAELQDRAAALNDRLSEIIRQMTRLEGEIADPKDVEATLLEFDPLWEQLSTWEQESFIRALVEQVRYDGKTGTVTVGFRSTAARDLCNWAADRLKGTE